MTTLTDTELNDIDARIAELMEDDAFMKFARETGEHLERIWSKITTDPAKWGEFYDDPARAMRDHGLLGSEHPVLDEPAMIAGIQEIMGGREMPVGDEAANMSCRKCKWLVALGIAVLLGVAVCAAVVLSGGTLGGLATWLTENIAEHPVKAAELAGAVGLGIWAAARWICKNVTKNC